MTIGLHNGSLGGTFSMIVSFPRNVHIYCLKCVSVIGTLLTINDLLSNKSSDIAKLIDTMPRSDCADAQTNLGYYCSHKAQHFFDMTNIK